MWNACGLYTSLPYGYNYQILDTIEDRMGMIKIKGTIFKMTKNGMERLGIYCV